MTFMRIRDIASKPSDAIKAMCRGLRAQANNPDFKVDMGTFGAYNSRNKKCYGCAATCALLEIGGKGPDPDYITDDMAEYLGFGPGELRRFEDAINHLRGGSLGPLFEFYDQQVPAAFADMSPYPHDLPKERRDRWYMSSNDWEEKLPLYDQLAADLAKRGY